MTTFAAARHVAPPSMRCALADAVNADAAGGKASGLARLIALDVPVPAGEVLTRQAFEALVAQPQLSRRLATLEGSIDGDTDPTTLQAVSDDIRRAVMAAPLPLEIEAALQAIGRRLLPGVVAVRSSAIGEDGASSSCAGQFDTVLNVSSTPALRDAVRRCYASYWSARAMTYRHKRDLDAAGMAVVVQRQIAPTAAGVLFTRNPSPYRSSETLVIEYCAGLADGLVGGAVDPGRLILSRTDLGVIEEVEGEPGSAAAREAVHHHAAALARQALSLEDRFGAPLDIEWAIDGAGSMWFVQARPITTALPSSSSATEVWWTNANVNENFPSPISPMLYSIAAPGYYHYFRNLGVAFGISRRRLAAMDGALRGIIGVHGARMYYNLTNIHAVLRMAPFGETLAGAFNTFVGADRVAASPAQSASFSGHRRRWLQAAELARIASCTAWQYLFLRRRIRQFERTADAFAADTRAHLLGTAPAAAVAQALAAFVEIRNHRWKNASLADAAAMVTFALLERVLASCGHGRDTTTQLLRALPEMPSSVPPRRLWELSRQIRADAALVELFASRDPGAILERLRGEARFADFRAAFDNFIDTWGFRSSAELMLTEPSLDERPEPVIALLTQYARDTGASPDASMRQQAAERRRQTWRVLRAIAPRRPLRAALIACLAPLTQRAVVYRERARLKQALLYTRLRRVLLRGGTLLVARDVLRQPDDVFMLTAAEAIELLEGRSMFAWGVGEAMALRRQHHQRLSALCPPDTFALPRGDVYAAASRAPRETSAASVPLPEGSALKGVTACGGVVTARAAVLAGVHEAARLSRGDVLVTRQTDPGWAPVFCLVSGLVIERGGMLSHGAIIAREFGLPCVVGVRGAARLIPHGATVTVDGTRGQCRIEAVG